MSKPRNILLRDMPDDVYEVLLDEQKKIKLEKRSGKFGIEQVIYKIVRLFNKQKADIPQ